MACDVSFGIFTRYALASSLLPTELLIWSPILPSESTIAAHVETLYVRLVANLGLPLKVKLTLFVLICLLG